MPHIDRVEYPSLHADDDIKDVLKAQVAAELRALETQKSNIPEASPDKSTSRRNHGLPDTC